MVREHRRSERALPGLVQAHEVVFPDGGEGRPPLPPPRLEMGVAQAFDGAGRSVQRGRPKPHWTRVIGGCNQSGLCMSNPLAALEPLGGGRDSPYGAKHYRK